MKITASFLICIASLLLWASATLAQGSEAFYLNDQGVTLMEHGKARESIRYFDKAISLEPGMAEYYMNRGSAYDDTGDAVRALQDFDKAIQLDPNLGSAYFNRGLTRLRMAHYKEALEDANKDVLIRPRHARSYFLRAGCYLMIGKAKEALADFDRCLAISPNEKLAVEGRAKALELIGKYKESNAEFTRAGKLPEGKFTIAPLAKPQAEQEAQNKRAQLALSRLNQSLKLNPNNADAVEWRCDVNFKLGHYKDCIADATNTLRLNPACVKVYALRGKSYMALNEYGKAYSDLTSALQFDSKSLELYALRAVASHQLHQYSQAISDTNKAIEISPSFTKLYFQRGISYLANNQFTEAVADLTKWVEAHPKYAGAYLSRADAYLQAGQLDKARADIDQAISLGESAHNICSLKAQIALKQGNTDEVIAICTKDLTECATSTQVLKLRAEAYRVKGKMDEALADLDLAIKLSPNDPALYGSRALLYQEKAMLAQALVDAQKASALAPQDVRQLLLVAELNGKLNNKATATELFDKAIKLAPNDPFVYQARAYSLENTNPTQAEADYDKAFSLTKDPSASLLVTSGSLKLKQKREKEALELFDKALPKMATNNTSRWAVLLLRAQAHMQLKDFESALKDLTSAIELRPAEASLYVARANLFSQLKRDQEAIQDLNKAMQIKPDALGYLVIGQEMLKLNKTNDAIEKFTKALVLDPKLLNARIARGYAYLEDNHFDKASEDIEIASQEAPTDSRVQLLRGLLLDQTGKLDEAIKQYNAIQQTEENKSQILRTRTNALFRAGNYKDSLDDAENFCKATGWKDDFCPYAALLGYFSSQRCGEKDKGLDLLNKAAANGTDKSAWIYQLISYAQGGLTDKQLLALAIDNDKLTEAHTYIGLAQELRNHKKQAIEHFAWVKTNGNVHFTEYPLAHTELKRLSTR